MSTFHVSHGTGSFIVIGETNLARHVCASLPEDGHGVQHLTEPRDEELRTAMTARPQGVAVLLHNDVAALRYALAIAHISAHVPITVTIFDRTVADELLRLLPQCDVTSLADLVAPALAGPCVDATFAALRHGGRGSQAVRMIGQGVQAEPWHPQRASLRSRLRRLAGQLRPHDAGTRIMLAGVAGMLAALVGDWAWLLGLGHPPAEALFDAARVVTTVGPDRILEGALWCSKDPRQKIGARPLEGAPNDDPPEGSGPSLYHAPSRRDSH